MPDSAYRKPLIDLSCLTKTYQAGHGTVEALKNVSLRVYQGESLAVMGPSGCGKSTLLHLLGCLDSPTSGNYVLNEKDVSNLSDSELAAIRASKIGFVFQSFNLVPQLNVFENVELPFLYQSKEPPQNLKDIIIASLLKVGLGNRLHHLPKELSGGEMQRVAIARALATEPLLILADEPTGNLDSENGHSILKLFSELNKQGVTIIVVTHDSSVANHCSRLIRMQDGSILNERMT
jgi:putative ABC transport system ATP-binding protein